MIEAGGVLFALDPNAFPFAPNINIIKLPGEVDLEFLESTVEGQLESIGARNITTEFVELPAGEALQIEYDLTLNQADGSTLDAHGVQYEVPSGGSTWAVTLTTDDIERDRAMFDQMIESLVVES
jgi:hypothetical protein